MGISLQKMVEMSTEPFANTGTSLCTARLCMCEWLSLQTLHLQLPIQNCNFVQKTWTPLSTEGIPLFLDALPRLKNTPLPGERKGSAEDHPFKPALYPWNIKNPKLHFPAVDLRVSTTLCPKRKKKNTLPQPTYIFLLQTPFLRQLISTGKSWMQHFDSAESTWGTFSVSWNRAVLAVLFLFGTRAVVRSSGKMCDPEPALPGCSMPCLSWATIMDPLWTSAVAWAAFRAPNSGRHKKKKSNCSAVQNMQYEEGWLGSALLYANYIYALWHSLSLKP